MFLLDLLVKVTKWFFWNQWLDKCYTLDQFKFNSSLEVVCVDVELYTGVIFSFSRYQTISEEILGLLLDFGNVLILLFQQ